MKPFTVFVFALMTAATVSFSFDAVADEKKCKEGHVYSEKEKKCIPKPGPKRPDKS
jgi:hypothetical protein